MVPKRGHWLLRNQPLWKSHPTRRRAPLNDRTLQAVTSGSGWRQEYTSEWFPIPLKSSFYPYSKSCPRSPTSSTRIVPVSSVYFIEQVFLSFPRSISIDAREEYHEFWYVSVDVTDFKRPKLTIRAAQGQSTTTQSRERTIDLASLAFSSEPLVPLSGDPWPTFDVVEAFTYGNDQHFAPTIVTNNPTPADNVTPARFPSPQKSRRRAEPLDQQSPSITQKKSSGSSSALEKPGAKRIPRPRNAFMIYRSTVWAQQKIPTGIERDHRHISRIIGHCWNSLPEEEKQIWRTRAEEEKREHLRKYPGYRYSPITRTNKPIKRNVNRNGEKDKQRCKKVAELLLSGTEGSALENAVKELDVTNDGCSSTSAQDSPTSPTSSQSPVTPLFSSKPLYRNEAQHSPKLFLSPGRNWSHELPTFSLSMFTPPEVSLKFLNGWWLVFTMPAQGYVTPTHNSCQFWGQFAISVSYGSIRPAVPWHARLPCFPRDDSNISRWRPRPIQSRNRLGIFLGGHSYPKQ